MKNPDIIIVGGGISGLSAAYELARAKLRVTLLEARNLGAMASTWTLGGVRQSGRDPAELPLARAAVERWQQLDEELDAQTGYRRRGNLRLARTPEEVAAIRTLVERQKSLGLAIDFLADNPSVRAVAPAIGHGVLAASFCPGDGHADPYSVIHAYAEAARRHGADVRTGMAVERILKMDNRACGVETAQGPLHADRVVIAAGIHAPALLAPLGITLPMTVKRVCVMQTVPAAPQFDQVFGVANADCAGRQESDGRFRITTGIGDWPGDPQNWNEAALRPALDDVTTLIGRTTPLLPVLSGLGLDRVWGGLIDLTPDALPVLDAPSAMPGLVIGAGFSGHGFGIGPVTGDILKTLVLGEKPGFDLTPFRLDRFHGQAQAPLTLHG